MSYNVFALFSLKRNMSFNNKFRAFLSGKKTFYVLIKNAKRYFYASSIEQARLKFMGHENQIYVSWK